MDLSRWRSLVVEAPLEPELPIVDAHHHCWDTPPVPEFEPYGREQLFSDVTGSGHTIVGTVYMEANSHYRTQGPPELRPVGETVFMDAVAEEGLRRGGRTKNVCAGIVTHADLTLGAKVGDVLDAHLAASRRFKGIRHRTTYDEDNALHSGEGPRMLNQPAFREGALELVSRGLTFDAMVLHPQIPEVSAFAAALPDLTIVLNHIGAPMRIGRFADRASDVFRDWAASMAELAARPNVVVKLGGLNMAFTGLSFVDRDRPPSSAEAAAKQRDFVLRTIDLFGPNRCMFESNFPVDALGISYGVVWNSFKRMVADFSPSEKNALFSSTATKVYRLNFA